MRPFIVAMVCLAWLPEAAFAQPGSRPITIQKQAQDAEPEFAEEAQLEPGTLAFAVTAGNGELEVIRSFRWSREEIREANLVAEFRAVERPEARWNPGKDLTYDVYCERYSCHASLKAISVHRADGTRLTSAECEQALQKQRPVLLLEQGFKLDPVTAAMLRPDALLLTGKWPRDIDSPSAGGKSGQRLVERTAECEPRLVTVSLRTPDEYNWKNSTMDRGEYPSLHIAEAILLLESIDTERPLPALVFPLNADARLLLESIGAGGDTRVEEVNGARLAREAFAQRIARSVGVLDCSTNLQNPIDNRYFELFLPSVMMLTSK